MAHDVFLSYASQDKPIADAVCAYLEQQGVRCWIAPRDVLPGEVWGRAIVEAIHKSPVMVVVFSSSSNESPQVMREVERAVNKGLVIIPFRIEAITPSENMEYFLSSTHWLDAMSLPLERHIEALVKTVRVFLERGRPPAPAGSVPSDAPASPRPSIVPVPPMAELHPAAEPPPSIEARPAPAVEAVAQREAVSPPVPKPDEPDRPSPSPAAPAPGFSPNVANVAQLPLRLAVLSTLYTAAFVALSLAARLSETTGCVVMFMSVVLILAVVVPLALAGYRLALRIGTPLSALWAFVALIPLANLVLFGVLGRRTQAWLTERGVQASLFGATRGALRRAGYRSLDDVD